MLCAEVTVHLLTSFVHMCITSARGHGLSGRVHAHAYNLIYAWACVANMLLITTTYSIALEKLTMMMCVCPDDLEWGSFLDFVGGHFVTKLKSQYEFLLHNWMCSIARR